MYATKSSLGVFLDVCERATILDLCCKHHSPNPQDSFQSYINHMELMAPEDVFIPKHHLMMHLIVRSAHFGNPRFYSTWRDESLNKTLKMACRTTSQATFENSVLTRMQNILAPSAGSKKRDRSP